MRVWGKEAAVDTRLTRAKRWTPFAVAGASIALAATISVTGAYAYFTTYASALGGHTLQLEAQTTIHEDFANWTKTVVVENLGDSPCYVRVAAFSPENFPLAYVGDGWTDGGDGYWYYNKLLAGHEKTSELHIGIKAPEQDFDQDFSVVVVHESTIVSNADGTGGDWTALDSSVSDAFEKEAANE